MLKSTNSLGVASYDFNQDGFTDILVARNNRVVALLIRVSSESQKWKLFNSANLTRFEIKKIVAIQEREVSLSLALILLRP